MRVFFTKSNRQIQIRREFNKFDANKDGEIDKAEFGQFLRGIGLIPSDDEVKVSCKRFNQKLLKGIHNHPSPPGYLMVRLTVMGGS